MRRPRVLLADDHALFLAAIEKLLAEECTIVGQVHDGRELMTAAQLLAPDVILLDIGMPQLNGLDAARSVRKILPLTKLVFLTMHEDPDLAAEAFRAGASAYLFKRSAASELSTAIHDVMEGRSYVTPLLASELVRWVLRNDRPTPDLTPRQREILQLLAEGQSMKQVAAVLNVTPRTVAFHKYQMMSHLKVKTTAELIQYAMRHHIV